VRDQSSTAELIRLKLEARGLQASDADIAQLNDVWLRLQSALAKLRVRLSDHPSVEPMTHVG